MPSCIVKGCSYHWKKYNPYVTLHSFPKDLSRIKQWLGRINQDFGNIDEFAAKVFEGTAKYTYRICSQHFTRDCYQACGTTTVLTSAAVPTIFPEPRSKHPTSETSSQIPRKRKKRNSVTPSTELRSRNDLRIERQEEQFDSAPFPIPIIERPKKESFRLNSSIQSQILPVYLTVPLVCSEEAGGLSQPQKEGPPPKNTKSVGVMTTYFPGQCHRSTQTEPYQGTHRKLQADVRKPHKSVGIQCNMERTLATYSVDALSEQKVPSL